MDVDEIVRADSFGPPRQVETVDLSLALYTLGAALERALGERGNGAALRKAADERMVTAVERGCASIVAALDRNTAAQDRATAAHARVAEALAAQKRPKVRAEVHVAPELRMPRVRRTVKRDLLDRVEQIVDEPLPEGGGA